MCYSFTVLAQTNRPCECYGNGARATSGGWVSCDPKKCEILHISNCAHCTVVEDFSEFHFIKKIIFYKSDGPRNNIDYQFIFDQLKVYNTLEYYQGPAHFDLSGFSNINELDLFVQNDSLAQKSIEVMSRNIRQFPKLSDLKLDLENLSAVPDFIFELNKLKTLELIKIPNNESIPANWSGLSSLYKLRLEFIDMKNWSDEFLLCLPKSLGELSWISSSNLYLPNLSSGRNIYGLHFESKKEIYNLSSFLAYVHVFVSLSINAEYIADIPWHLFEFQDKKNLALNLYLSKIRKQDVRMAIKFDQSRLDKSAFFLRYRMNYNSKRYRGSQPSKYGKCQLKNIDRKLSEYKNEFTDIVYPNAQSIIRKKHEN